MISRDSSGNGNNLIQFEVEAKTIDLNDWTLFGEGGVAKTYIGKSDPAVVLKLNNESYEAQIAYGEFIQSKNVCSTGIPCPQFYDFVTDGSRYGYTSQRIMGKKSYSRLLADNPPKIGELAAQFAARTRELHAVKCDTSLFPALLDVYKSFIDSSDVFPDDVRAILQSYYDERDTSATSCLHGDLQMGNLINASGKDYWIDLGSFGYGDPLGDLATMTLIADYFPSKHIEEVFHNSRRRFRRFNELFLKAYFGGEPDPAVREKINRLALLKAGVCVAFKPENAWYFYPAIRGRKFLFSILRLFSRFLPVKVS